MSGIGGGGSSSSGAGRGGSKSTGPRPVKIAAVSLVDLKEQANKAPTQSRGWGVIPQPAASSEASGVSSSLFPPVTALKQQFHSSSSSASSLSAALVNKGSGLARAGGTTSHALDKKRGVMEQTAGEGGKNEGGQQGDKDAGNASLANRDQEGNRDKAEGAGAQAGGEDKPATRGESPASTGSSNAAAAGASGSLEKSGEKEEKNQKAEGDKNKAEGGSSTDSTQQPTAAEEALRAGGTAISLSKLITATKKVGISVSVRGRAVNTAAGTVKPSGSAWKSGVSAAASSSGSSASAPFFAGAACAAGVASAPYAARVAGAVPTGAVDEEAFPDLMKSAEQVKLEAQKEKDRQKRAKEALRRAEKGDDNAGGSQPHARRLGLQELMELTTDPSSALSGGGDKSGDKDSAARPARPQRRWADEEPEEEEDFLQGGNGADAEKGLFCPFDGRRDFGGRTPISPLPHYVFPGMEGSIVAGYLSFISVGQRDPPPSPPPLDTYPVQPAGPPRQGAAGPVGVQNFRTNAFYNLPAAGNWPGAPGGPPPQAGGQMARPGPSLLREKNWRQPAAAAGPDTVAPGSLLPTNAFQGSVPPQPGRLHVLQRDAGDREGLQQRTLPPPYAVGQPQDPPRFGLGGAGPQRGIPFAVTEADIERQRELAKAKAEERKREEEEREREQKERANRKLQELDERLARSGKLPGGAEQDPSQRDTAAPSLQGPGAAVALPYGKMDRTRGASVQDRGGPRGHGAMQRPTSSMVSGDERENEDWRRPSPPADTPSGGKRSPRAANAGAPFPPALSLPRNPPPPPPLAAAGRGRHDSSQKSLLGAAGKNVHHLTHPHATGASGDPASPGPLLVANPNALIGGADVHGPRGHLGKKGAPVKGEPGAFGNDGVPFQQASLLGPQSQPPPPPGGVPPAPFGAPGAGRGPHGKGIAGGGPGPLAEDRDDMRFARGRQGGDIGPHGPVGPELVRGVNGEEPLPPLLSRERPRGAGAQYSAPPLHPQDGHREMEEGGTGFAAGRGAASQAAADAGREEGDEHDGVDGERRQAARPRYRFGALVNQHLEERQREEDAGRGGPQAAAEPEAIGGAAQLREKSARGAGERGRGAGQQPTAEKGRSRSAHKREGAAGPDAETWRQAPGEEREDFQQGRERGHGEAGAHRGRGPKRDMSGSSSQPVLLPGSSPAAAGSAAGPQKPLPRGMLPFPSPMRGGQQPNGSQPGRGMARASSPSAENSVEGGAPQSAGGGFTGRERAGRGPKQPSSPTSDNWRAEKPAAPGAYEETPRLGEGVVSGGRAQGAQQHFPHGAGSQASSVPSQAGAQAGPQQPPLIANVPLLGFPPSSAGPAGSGSGNEGKGFQPGMMPSASAGSSSANGEPGKLPGGGPQTAGGNCVKDLHKNATLWQLSSASFPTKKPGAANGTGGGADAASGAGLLRKPNSSNASVEDQPPASAAAGPSQLAPTGGTAGTSDLSFKALLSARPSPAVLVATHHAPKGADDGLHLAPAPASRVAESAEAALSVSAEPSAAAGSAKLPTAHGRGGAGSRAGEGGKGGLAPQQGGNSAPAAPATETAGHGAGSGRNQGAGRGSQRERDSAAKAEETERGSRGAGSYRKGGGNAGAGAQRSWAVVEKLGKSQMNKGDREEADELRGTSGADAAASRVGWGEGTGRGAALGANSARPQRAGDCRQEEEAGHAGEGGGAARGGRGGGAAPGGAKDPSAGRNSATSRGRGSGAGADGGRAHSPSGAAASSSTQPPPRGPEKERGSGGDASGDHQKGREQGQGGARGGRGGRGVRGGSTTTGGRGGSVHAEKGEQAPGASPLNSPQGEGASASSASTEESRHRGHAAGRPAPASSRQAGAAGGSERGDKEAGARGPGQRGGAAGQQQGAATKAGGSKASGGGPAAFGRERNAGGAGAAVWLPKGAAAKGQAAAQEDEQSEEVAADDEGFQLVKSKRREQQEKRKKAEQKQRGTDNKGAAAANAGGQTTQQGSGRQNARRDKGQHHGAAASSSWNAGAPTTTPRAQPTEEAPAGSTAAKSGAQDEASAVDRKSKGEKEGEGTVASGGGRGQRHEGGGRKPSASPRGDGRSGGGRGGSQAPKRHGEDSASHGRDKKEGRASGQGEGRKDFSGSGKGGTRGGEGTLTAATTVEIATNASEGPAALEEQRATRPRGEEEPRVAREAGDSAEKKEASAFGLLPLPAGTASSGASARRQSGGGARGGRGSSQHRRGNGESGQGKTEGEESRKDEGTNAREERGHEKSGRERRGSAMGKGGARRGAGGFDDSKRRQGSPAVLEGKAREQGAQSAATTTRDPWHSASQQGSAYPSQQGMDAAGNSVHAQPLLSEQGGGAHLPVAGGSPPGDRGRTGASPTSSVGPAYSLWSSNFNQPVTASSRVAPETIAAIWARDTGSAPTAVGGGAPRGGRMPGSPTGAPGEMAGLAPHHHMTPVGMPIPPHHQGGPADPFHQAGGPLGPSPLHFPPQLHRSMQPPGASRGASSGLVTAADGQLMGQGGSHRVPPSHVLHASQHLMHGSGAPAQVGGSLNPRAPGVPPSSMPGSPALFQPGCYGAPGGAAVPRPGAPRMPAQRNVAGSLAGAPGSLSKAEMLGPPLLPGTATPGLVTLPPGQGGPAGGAHGTGSSRMDLYDPRNPLAASSFAPVPQGSSHPHSAVVAGSHPSYVIPDASHLLPAFAHPQGPAFSSPLGHEGAAPGAPGGGRAGGPGGPPMWVAAGSPGAGQAGAFVASSPGPHHQQGRGGHPMGRGSDMLSPTHGFGAFMPAQGGGRNGNGAQQFGGMGAAGQRGAGAAGGGGEFYM
ncbi:hypothetical protein BESB_074250 [Besnoitia besnoiti]|uniref:Uncharacterized protein n=1 Tax=Besnoitia besnoiti TaxID=94643 RepID=A0A2A9MF26_BESBE|nr:uncharacterized protein BESB_074250 [Besnoitia besnoiti]PFH34273.1 hypothetical protein BESB_074250 [Besnoitia besnoiti]